MERAYYKKYWIVLKRLANQLHNRDINLSACRLLCYRVDIWDGSCKAKISAFHRELRARVVAEFAHTPLHSARAREITYRVKHGCSASYCAHAHLVTSHYNYVIINNACWQRDCPFCPG